MARKKYDYDEVIEMLNTNGPIDQVLLDFQQKVGEYEAAIDQMQTMLEGKQGKTVYRAYEALYDNVGEHNGNSGHGFWGIIGNMAKLHNTMYSRAVEDKNLDELGYGE